MRRASLFSAFASVGLLLLLLVPGGARADGATPVAPDPSSPDAQLALLNEISGDSAYSIDFQFDQQVSPSTTSCGAGCYVLGIATATVSDPSSNISGVLKQSIVSASVVSGCTGFCPPFTWTCDGHTVNPPTVSVPCYASTFNFNSVHATAIPKVLIVRLHEFVVNRGAAWVSSGGGASLSSSVVSWSPAVYGPIATTAVFSWTIPQVSWVVPLPAGSWSASATQVEFLNTSTFLTSAQFSQQSTWILIQWHNFVTSVCLSTCEPPVAHQPVLNYLFEVTTANGKITHNGGGLLPGSTGNLTQPSNTTGEPQLNTYVVLTFTNLTYVGGGNYTTRIVWANHYTFPVLGPWIFVTNLLGQGSNLSVAANGAPVGSNQIGLSSNSVEIYPGAVTVANGSIENFAITFHYTPTLDPNAPLVLLNGAPVTVAEVVAGGMAALASALALAEANLSRLRRYRFIGAAEGILALAALLVTWIYA